MKARSGINTTNAPKDPSPLWIIALFIALSEVTAGIAAIATDGSTRVIFAVFTVSFPVVVLLVFLWLLLAHPANLYSPWQYTDQTSVSTYAMALNRESRATTIVYSKALSEAFEAIVEAIEQNDLPAGASDRSLARRQVARVFDDVVAASSIIVDRSAFAEGPELRIPVTDESTVSDLLDSIFFSLSPAVEPFTYGSDWLLVDKTGRPYKEIGTNWAREQGWVEDDRVLESADIRLGSRFAAIIPGSSTS